MLRNSFQARIAGVLVLLLLVVVGALYAAVQAATNAAVRSQAHEQLEVGGGFRLQGCRGRDDADTIRSAMANHGARINASAVMVLSLDGNLEVSTDREISEQTARRLSAQVTQHQRDGVQIFLMPIADKIYLLVQATVAAPLPIVRVMMGFQVDDVFAAELRELAHLDLTLLATQQGAPDIWISTLRPA